ncbi:substrate-binding domain-containing protein [Streptomyces durmitorensis]|uniref:substrate-binding domain-containing protein n=1 Tax=Streptomyces durmitorensis TaxID=319947 RepID=UPI003220408E
MRDARQVARAWPGSTADPPLATVHQPFSEMAASATELALALGRGERVPQRGLEIATRLVVRRSRALRLAENSATRGPSPQLSVGVESVA